MAVDINLTVDKARAIRHEAGMRKYRQDPNGPYVGDPVLHAYEEALDLINYTEEARRQGRMCLWMVDEAKAIARDIRTLLISEDARKGSG